jgi:radical SAM superfamily enzyme YgiQ (UPF0313 family)
LAIAVSLESVARRQSAETTAILSVRTKSVASLQGKTHEHADLSSLESCGDACLGRNAVGKRSRVALLGHSSAHEEFTYAFGLYRIAAYCRWLGLPHEIRVFDRNAAHDEADDLALLADHRPDVVGLSAYLWNLPRIVRLVEALQALQPRPLVVVGGPSATAFEDLAPSSVRPDLLVVGYGERTFAAILQAHAAGELASRIAELGHVVTWGRGFAERIGRPEVSLSLDELPSPYLDGTAVLRGHATLYVETDRGCPYSCAFCIESTSPPKVARFSLERVEQELAWARDRGFEQVELCSAILNLDTQWLERFVEMVERVDPDRRLAFSAALFTTHLDERQAELFGRLRMKSALFGLNTINRATFKDVRRAIHPERFREKIELYARHARPQVSLIMGLPGDTPEGLQETLAFADTLPADVMMFRFMVLPNTLYYEQREQLQLEIDHANDNRIVSTWSYSAEDFARMETIAAAAGFDEINPGEWVRREGHERFAVVEGAMSRRKWNLLYLALQGMDLGARGWPDGWKHVRVFLEVERWIGVSLRRDDGDRIDIYACERSVRPVAFHRSRHFELASRDPRHDAKAPRGPLLDAFALAFDEAERAQLDRQR